MSFCVFWFAKLKCLNSIGNNATHNWSNKNKFLNALKCLNMFLSKYPPSQWAHDVSTSKRRRVLIMGCVALCVKRCSIVLDDAPCMGVIGKWNWVKLLGNWGGCGSFHVWSTFKRRSWVINYLFSFWVDFYWFVIQTQLRKFHWDLASSVVIKRFWSRRDGCKNLMHN